MNPRNNELRMRSQVDTQDVQHVFLKGDFLGIMHAPTQRRIHANSFSYATIISVCIIDRGIYGEFIGEFLYN